jgi:hypothetical protein
MELLKKSSVNFPSEERKNIPPPPPSKTEEIQKDISGP